MRSLTLLGIVVFALFTLPVSAGPREDVLAAMQRCSSIPDDRVWLDCTYGAQQIMRARLGLPPAPDFQQRLVPPDPALSTQTRIATTAVPSHPTPRGHGGLFGGSRPIEVSVLVAVRYDSQGAFIATLQNGEIWRQANVQSGDARVRLTLGSKVAILPGSLWSYDLKIEDDPHAYKVDRQT